jgi:hypothetical protein
MLRRTMLSIFAIAISAANAGAADIARQSRLGAIFAEPADARAAARSREYSAPIIGYNRLPNPIWARGGYYYGSPWSYFDNGAYYGGPISFSGGRLPYVCGLYGYC